MQTAYRGLVAHSESFKYHTFQFVECASGQAHLWTSGGALQAREVRSARESLGTGLPNHDLPVAYPGKRLETRCWELADAGVPCRQIGEKIEVTSISVCSMVSVLGFCRVLQACALHWGLDISL